MIIDTLKNRALELGLQAVGIAPAIDEVRAVYPWAESVAVAAVCYLPPERQMNDDEPRGWVARVARSADYHTVLRNKLTELSEILEEERARVEICVDTCPLSERKLAVLAGIGWRGKNSNVFVEGCGSYAAIGEIVTDLKLSVSEPMNTDRCGECDRCIKACPANAIVAPGVVDRNRCLSQVTQSSKLISEETRLLLGNRIYGCDICQEVCPQNAGVKPVNPEFTEDVFPGECPELIPLIRLTSVDFNNNIKKSSIGWIRRTRIRRNAAIATGNLRCEQAVPALIDMLHDENPALRVYAAWALGNIGSMISVSALKNALETERDQDVIKEIRACLSKNNIDMEDVI